MKDLQEQVDTKRADKKKTEIEEDVHSEDETDEDVSFFCRINLEDVIFLICSNDTFQIMNRKKMTILTI